MITKDQGSRQHLKWVYACKAQYFITERTNKNAFVFSQFFRFDPTETGPGPQARIVLKQTSPKHGVKGSKAFYVFTFSSSPTGKAEYTLGPLEYIIEFACALKLTSSEQIIPKPRPGLPVQYAFVTYVPYTSNQPRFRDGETVFENI